MLRRGDAPGRQWRAADAAARRVDDGPLKLHVDDEVVAEDEIRTQASRFALCGEGLCIGYDGGDAVTSEYQPKFEFTGGSIVKVVFDVADDAYLDVERHLAAAMARD